MKAQERLYLTAGRDALVRQGDKRAAFLYAAEGDEIPASAAEKFGLVEGALKAAPPEKPKPSVPSIKPASQRKPVAKEVKPAPATKEQKPAETKDGAGGDGDGSGTPPEQQS